MTGAAAAEGIGSLEALLRVLPADATGVGLAYRQECEEKLKQLKKVLPADRLLLRGASTRALD